jgi:hypothetical protein
MAGRLDETREFKLLNTLPLNREYCLAQPKPDGEYVPIYKMVKGQSIAARYPADQYSVELALDPDWPGLKLPSIIGNAGNLIILHKDVANFIQTGFKAEPFEAFSFTLTNHKGRVHSKDYVFFGPLALCACLRGRKPDPTALERQLVLYREKMQDAGDIFRVREARDNVMVSAELADALVAKGFTNFEFTDVLYSDR